MASGLVPMTSLMSAKRSLPPSSAGGNCLHYGLSSTKIVGVGLELHPDGRRVHDMKAEPVLLAVGNRRFLAGEIEPHLRLGVARSVPAGQRIGPHRLRAFELEQPPAGNGLAG